MNPEFQSIVAKQMNSLHSRLLDLAARAPATWGPVEAGWLIARIAEEIEEPHSLRADQRKIFVQELENDLQPMPF